MNLVTRRTLVFLCLMLLCADAIWSQQGEIVTFGKNRVQYHRDFDRWDRYETDNFITHWYGRGRKIAEAVVQYAELENESIRSLLEHRTNEKIDIIVYTDITDLHQTNLGDNELFETKPGEVNVMGKKIFVYFDGNQQHLRLQIREGIAKVYLAQMLFVENWQEFFQSFGSEDYPKWYIQGIVAYARSRWDLKTDNTLRDIFQHNAYKDFYALAQDYPKLAGQMFWLYLSERYGESIIANILYLNRINRRFDAAFYYSLNEDVDFLIEQIWQFFSVAYLRDIDFMAMPSDEHLLDFKNKYCSAITKLRYSPDGFRIALVTNELGKWAIRVFDLETGKDKVLLKGSYRNPFQKPDHDYPMIEWSDEGERMVVIYEKNDIIHIIEVDISGNVLEKDIIAPPFERIYDFDIAGKDTLVFSANVGGAADIFLYLLKTRQMRRLSYDYYDDLGVSMGQWNGEKGFFFASNRARDFTYRQLRDTTLVKENLDIYFVPLSNLRRDSASAKRITETKYNHKDPQFYDGKVYFLAERNGRRVLAAVDEAGNTEYLSGWRSNIHAYHVHEDIFATSLLENGKAQAYIDLELNQTGQNVLYRTFFSSFIHPFEIVERDMEDKEEEPPQKPEKRLIFQSEFPDPENIPSFRNISYDDSPMYPGREIIGREISSQTGPVHKFQSSRVVASRLFFKTDGLEFDLDNSPLFSGLNSYAGEKEGYDYPPFGLLIKGHVYDTFEDYILEGGARFPVSLDGSEYFLVFRDKKRRWDKIYGLYRKSEKHSPGGQAGGVSSIQRRNVSYIGTYELRYPFNMYKSIRLRATFRQDRLTTFAIENRSLRIPSENAQRIGLRAEYVFDNTYDMAYNMKNGMRYKVYTEVMNRFEVQFAPWNFKPQEGFMTIVGFDARKYFRLGRHSILAMRGVGETSFGSEQILFLMGGVENWLFPVYTDLEQPGAGNFAYRGLAANMRGFKQNIRNGSTYLLGNIELRVAPFNYLSRKQLNSSFLRNFQVVGFLDFGTAWYGLSPYGAENPLNQITVKNATAVVRARYYRDPLVAGFGGGVRAMLLGMFLKMDYGWGYDTKRVGDPVFYFSLGKDF